jgi:hypothetical protein
MKAFSAISASHSSSAIDKPVNNTRMRWNVRLSATIAFMDMRRQSMKRTVLMSQTLVTPVPAAAGLLIAEDE